jgi:hypothetical protein
MRRYIAVREGGARYGRIKPVEFGGSNGTADIAKAVIDALEQQTPPSS